MERNQFEGLEEVEIVEAETEEIKEVKEYEKLLMAERDRADYAKAVNLVKYGCFKQVEEKTIDFSKYVQIKSKKQFKSIYKLYRNLETMELTFIAPLVENNKGDVDENKEMAPYAYDVLYIDFMDNETYNEVCHAAKNNLPSLVGVLYKASFICFFVLVAMALFTIIFNLVTLQSDNFVKLLGTTLYYSSPFIVGVFTILPLLVLITIKYKKYKDQ